MNWFKKLAKRTKFILILAFVILVAGLASAAYLIYRSQVSASTQTAPVTISLNIAGAKVATSSITEATALSSFGIYSTPGNARQGYATVRGINSSFTVSIASECASCFFRLQTSQLVSTTTGANFNSQSGARKVTPGDVYNIFANADGSMSVNLMSSGQSSSGGASIGTKKCTSDPEDDTKYIYIEKIDASTWRVVGGTKTYPDNIVANYPAVDASRCGQQSSPGGTVNSQTKCVELGGEWVLLTKNGDFWNGTQKNGNTVQIHNSQIGAYSPDPTKCASQTGTTGNTGQTGSNQATSLTVVVTMNGKPASGFRVTLKVSGQQDLTHSTDSSGKYVFDWGAGALTQTLYGDVTVGDETLQKDALYHEVTIAPGSKQTITFTCTNPQEGSPNGTCNSNLAQQYEQPAREEPNREILPVPLFGWGGGNFPTGNNSVIFKAVRYSLAEEDPVQVALSGQGQQSFVHYTPVGGASFEITLLTQATQSQNTGQSNQVAFAADNNTELTGGNPEQAQGQSNTQTNTQSNTNLGGSGPINTGEVTQLQCEKNTAMEGVISRMRRIGEFRSYRISGTIPDNGTNSAISVINLPDGYYKVQVSKSGFTSCTAYFSLEGGKSSDVGGIPLVAKSSTLEPPSISSAQVSKIPGDDRTLGNVYLAQKGASKYVYSSKCTRLGWVPEGQIGAMITTPLCQRYPQIGQSGENIFTDQNGNPLTGPALEAVLANIYNRCSGANISIFGGSSGNDKMNPLEAMLIGAAGGAFGAQTSKGEIVTKDVVYPAGVALIAALTGSDVNIGVGNNCIGQSLPSYNMGVDCRTCYYCPPGAMCDPGPAPGQPYCPNQCYTQSWPNQIPWYMLDRAQSRLGR